MTDQELLDAMRHQFDGLIAKAIVERDSKGYEDPTLRTEIENMKADISTKIDDVTGKLRRFMESRANVLPGNGGGANLYKTFGHSFLDSREFKEGLARGLQRRDHITAIVNQRILPAERKVITEAGSGWVLFPQRIGVSSQPPEIPLVMRDLFNVVAISGTNAIEYLIQNWTFNADYQVAEGDKKAESTVAFTEATATVKTIAHFVKISRQMLADVPYVAGQIDDKLIYGLLKKEDTELLLGNNAAGHLHGVLPQAQAYAGTAPAVGASLVDAVMGAITQVGTNGYVATNIVMNPADWGAEQVRKTAQGLYVLGGPPAAPGAQRLWGLPVTLTPIIPVGTTLVGQFPATATIYDRETATVDIAFENEDDFIRNLVCIRAEERLAFVVTDPAAYVKVVRSLTLANEAEAEPARGAKK
jgi:HK97 family phage major capsid protein